MERTDELTTHFQDLIESIKTESYVFNMEFENESEMLEAIDSFFISIHHHSLDDIIEMYYDFKANAHESDRHMRSMKVVEKILVEYILFMNKLSAAILGSTEASLSFEPNIDDELNAFLKSCDETPSNKKSLWFPILTALGLGFLLGAS